MNKNLKMALEIRTQFDFWPKFDLCWLVKDMIYTDSESVKNFQSFKIYVIKIGQLGGALEPLSGFC